MKTFSSIRKQSPLFIVIASNENNPQITQFTVEKTYQSPDDKVVIKLPNGVKAKFNPNLSMAYLESNNYTQYIFTERNKAEEFYLSLKK